MNHLQEEYKNTNVGVAFIYCNHKETETQTASNLIASLWRQLAFGRHISSDVHDLYLKHNERHTKPSLDEIVSVLRSAVADYLRVFVIVDALDECPNEKNTRDIVLTRLTTLGPTVNLLLTSRPNIGIEMIFPDIEQLEIRASPHDIRLYIKAQINSGSRLAKHCKDRPNLQEEIEKKIISRADGMYALALVHPSAFF